VSDAEQELTPEQLADAIRGMKISDLLLSTVTTLAELVQAKLAEGTRDLDQARIGIEAVRSLLDVIAPSFAEELMRDLHGMLAQLQLAYASAAGPAATA
jgi:hypothetical protein